MKKVFILFALLTISSQAMADRYVSGYTRSNGTYVQGHYRSEPNYTQRDNYSVKPNYNPYTHQKGTVDIDNQEHNYGYNHGRSYDLNNDNDD